MLFKGCFFTKSVVSNFLCEENAVRWTHAWVPRVKVGSRSQQPDCILAQSTWSPLSLKYLPAPRWLKAKGSEPGSCLSCEMAGLMCYLTSQQAHCYTPLSAPRVRPHRPLPFLPTLWSLRGPGAGLSEMVMRCHCSSDPGCTALAVRVLCRGGSWLLLFYLFIGSQSGHTGPQWSHSPNAGQAVWTHEDSGADRYSLAFSAQEPLSEPRYLYLRPHSFLESLPLLSPTVRDLAPAALPDLCLPWRLHFAVRVEACLSKDQLVRV